MWCVCCMCVRCMWWGGVFFVTVSLFRALDACYRFIVFVQYFRTWRQRVISMQSVERQSLMMTCFDNLMEGVERNLQSRNKDK